MYTSILSQADEHMCHGWSRRFRNRLVIEVCASERDWNKIWFVEGC